MYAQVLQRLRNERETGVPRRFSIRDAFILVTIFCVLFRVLVLLGFNATWTGLCCVFVGVVTLAQMFLFRGLRPRAASLVAGTVTPVGLFSAVVFDEMFTQRTGLTPLASGLGTMGEVLPVVIALAAFGLMAGYLVGVAMAGVFYVLPRGTHAVETTITNSPPKESRFLELLTESYHVLGRFLNPFPEGTPFRGAVAMFEVTLVMTFLVAPFWMFGTYTQIWIGGAVLGVVLGFLVAGNGELLFFWPIVLGGLGYALAAMLIDPLLELPMVGQFFPPGRQTPFSVFVKFTCVLAGITLSASVGWLQWITLRKRAKVRFGLVALLLSCAFLLGVVVFAKSRILAYANTPLQRLLANVQSQGGTIVWDFNRQFSWVELPHGFSDDEFLQLLPHIPDGGGVSLAGPKITNKSLAALDGRSLSHLSLINVSTTESAFRQTKSFSVAYLSFLQCPVNSSLLADLFRDPKMCAMLERIALADADIDEGMLAEMRVCKSLNNLHLKNCKISDEAWPMVSSLRALKQLQIHGGLDDARVKKLVASLPASVNNVSLASNDLTDAGMLEMAKHNQLQWLDISNNPRITASGVRDFRALKQQCQVRWSEPD